MTYGYTFHKDTREITGEQDVLRYSAYDLWCKNKNAYRERYYKGKSLQTAETIFGHEIHKLMETKEGRASHPVLSQLPFYDRHEYNVEESFRGITIGGCIDSFDPKELSLLDYKSSHQNKDGKAPWDNVRVAKHTQLAFYSFLVFLRFGKFNPYTHLVWIETGFKNKEVEFAGHVLSAELRELYLTGHFEVFKRRIAKWEIEALKENIIKVAGEINEDFKKYHG